MTYAFGYGDVKVGLTVCKQILFYMFIKEKTEHNKDNFFSTEISSWATTLLI